LGCARAPRSGGLHHEAGHLPDSGLGDGERLRAGLHGHAPRLPESRNLHAVRDEKTTPQVVLYQFDSSDP
ncbi:unnamed protein product, partial [Symbiodinium necroappetens]